MNKNLPIAVICSAAVALAASAVADNGDALPAILVDEAVGQAHFLPDFSYAGYRNGASDIPTATCLAGDEQKYTSSALLSG